MSELGKSILGPLRPLTAPQLCPCDLQQVHFRPQSHRRRPPDCSFCSHLVAISTLYSVSSTCPSIISKPNLFATLHRSHYESPWPASMLVAQHCARTRTHARTHTYMHFCTMQQYNILFENERMKRPDRDTHTHTHTYTHQAGRTV